MRLSFDEYINICDEISQIENPAPDWLPSAKDLYDIAAENPEKYLMFLIYLSETSNAMHHGGHVPKLINEILTDHLEFID